MNLIIQSTLNTLAKSQIVLSNLTDKQLADVSVSPYYSSIGSHIRHILDFYDCIFNDNENLVDLTTRKRNLDVENCCATAMCYLSTIVEQLNNLSNVDIAKEVMVTDDLGLGKIQINYTFASLLAQANSHTIHHYAIINYILDRLNISISDANFGYNATTPK
ncbi:hypothetical protein KO494_14020 [Lacinutrix sp. C3R15]|uniref:hypothetical protein n=1 Tax=Flavobacteriaceae TaxID=49546 RepID=UPI001C0A4408|nr:MULTISPECIES: hypothetical protein [Flavobacteriaceae]MBU2940660.1 hypothetical protein [Lacinutrix sp. C3R15]MDO6623978.1 hypothetical protein [Oceanihabitans sp. 1_MG-2023]